MRRRDLFAVCFAIVGLVGIVRAEDAVSPAGTWKWTVMMNDQKREVTLKLKYESDKLTGVILGRDNQETAIDDATFKDGEVAFSVTRERNGQKNTTKYKGKLDGDTIKGKADFTRNGEAQSRDWDAKREKS